MRITYICFIACILTVTMAGCENYDKAIQGIEKGREFIGNAEKKVTETRKEAEKSVGRILGKDIAKSEEKKSDDKEGEEKHKKDKD